MSGHRQREWYEQVWVIVVAFILFWPAGIVLLIWRLTRDSQLSGTKSLGNLSDYGSGPEYGNTGSPIDQNRQATMLKKSASKRRCKAWKVWGWVLLIIGILMVFSLPDSVGGPIRDLLMDISMTFGCIIAGACLLMAAKKQVAKWDLYDSFIKKNGNTPVSYLVRKTGYNAKSVRNDLTTMINNGFFVDPNKGRAAYFDGEYDLLVITKYGECMEPLRKDEPAPEPTPEEQFAKSNQYIAGLRREIRRTKDEELLITLKDIEDSVRKIEEKLEDQPDLKNMTNIKKLHGTYLPQAMELIRKFNEEEVSDEIGRDIKAMLQTCAQAFDNIEGKIYEREDIDTKVDMEVLRKTLEREGLLGSDFDLKTGAKGASKDTVE